VGTGGEGRLGNSPLVSVGPSAARETSNGHLPPTGRTISQRVTQRMSIDGCPAILVPPQCGSVHAGSIGIVFLKGCLGPAWLEAPPWTPSTFGEKGTGSSTIGMGNEAKRTHQFWGAREERPGDRRELLAVGGAVRRCGVDVGLPIGPLSQNVQERSEASIPPLASHPKQKPIRTHTRSSARVAGSYVVAPAAIRLPREARATQVRGNRASGWALCVDPYPIILGLSTRGKDPGVLTGGDDCRAGEK
jgi:hypothetical protein